MARKTSGKAKDTLPSPVPPANGIDGLFSRVPAILDRARSNVVRQVNSEMILAYWHIGREIVEEIQKGRERAEYGRQVLDGLSRRLTKKYGPGYSVTNLRYFRIFYQTYVDRAPEIRHMASGESAPPLSEQKKHHEASDVFQDLSLSLVETDRVRGFSSALSWTHYRTLSKVENRAERLFYEIEAEKEGWSVPHLERQIHSLLFARLFKSRDKAGVLELAREGLTIRKPADALKDPYVLDLPDSERLHESDLEAAIIQRLQEFLLELGKGFAFVARQKRLAYDDEHFYVDLVFYNCILKCFVLIGSKKFTEGWNSWRVANMGLMNVGATEGAQIIQLFGRGVRLKGFNLSLKRSNKTELPEEITRPKDLSLLETLSIFGIRANYMAQFRDFLAEEGLPTNDDRTEIILPIIKNLGKLKLKTIRLKKTINGVSTEFGSAFRKLGPVPTLGPPTDYLQRNQVVLNWYPKIQALKSRGVTGGDDDASPNQTHLGVRHLAFLDLEAIFFDLERFKAERGWYNLNISRNIIGELLLDQSWYQLQIPAEELAFSSFNSIRLWQEIATALLKKYLERYYSYCKREWEMPHLEYQDVEENDPNFLVRESQDGYRVLIENSQEEIITKIREL